MLLLRNSLQLPNSPTILIENPIFPFDKSRYVARKSRLPLISPSRTSLSSVLLHNPDHAASKCFFWPIRTDFLRLLPKLPVKIKMKKCMGVGCVVECVEESREREKRNGMFWNESGRILATWSSGVFFFFKKYLLVCSSEEEKYKEKSKVELRRSKE